MVDSNQDNPNPHKPRNPFDIKREPVTSHAPDQPNNQDVSPRAIFDHAALYNDHPELWDQDAGLRTDRFNMVFLPLVQNNSNHLSETGRQSLQTWVDAVQKVSGKKLADLEPQVDTINVAGIRNQPYIRLGTGHITRPTPENTDAAGIFLEALMPELGMSLETNWNDVKEKVEELQQKGFVSSFLPINDIHTADMDYLVPTIIPGFRVWFHRINIDDDRNFEISVQPPRKYP